MAQLTRAQAVQVLRGGLAEAMRGVAAGYAIPLSWVYACAGRPVVPANGSAFLLDCGNGPFLVTANHVYRGYLKTKAQHDDTVSIVGETKIPLHERVIAQDRAHDVATFRLAETEVADIKKYGKVVLSSAHHAWPPDPPCVDHGVFFVGFPGEQRTMFEYRGNSVVEIEFGAYTALAAASSVSATGISILFQHEQTFDVGLRAVIPTARGLGGCSGAPVLTFVEHKQLFWWRLGGIVVEASQGLVKAARADCLNIDGTINPHPDPNAYRKRTPQQGEGTDGTTIILK